MTIATLYTIREVLAAALHSLKTGEDSSATVLNKFERVMIAVEAAIAQLEKENTPVTRDLLLAIGGAPAGEFSVRFTTSPGETSVYVYDLKPGSPAAWIYQTSGMEIDVQVPECLAPQTMSAAVSFLLGMGVVLTVSPPAPDARVPLAQPLKLRNGEFIEASLKTATHLKLRFPGPSGTMYLPVCLNSKEEKSWLWNGDVYAPTLTPSVCTRMGHADHETICHSWVREGRVEFLGDSTHEHAGKTLDLLPVEPVEESDPDEAEQLRNDPE